MSNQNNKPGTGSKEVDVKEELEAVKASFHQLEEIAETRTADINALREDKRELVSALMSAVDVIKQWHCSDHVWPIYYEKAPEMKIIREAVEKNMQNND